MDALELVREEIRTARRELTDAFAKAMLCLQNAEEHLDRLIPASDTVSDATPPEPTPTT